jgi:N6-L-threonylcarbamoyladenine synthase
MTIIGETTDDAVGEAFDKSAKILGSISWRTTGR